jgi:hypothetical protein
MHHAPHMDYGPLELERYVKDDGRILIIYTLRRPLRQDTQA